MNHEWEINDNCMTQCSINFVTENFHLSQRSNQRPLDYKITTLPIELNGLSVYSSVRIQSNHNFSVQQLGSFFTLKTRTPIMALKHTKVRCIWLCSLNTWPPNKCSTKTSGVSKLCYSNLTCVIAKKKISITLSKLVMYP